MGQEKKIKSVNWTKISRKELNKNDDSSFKPINLVESTNPEETNTKTELKNETSKDKPDEKKEKIIRAKNKLFIDETEKEDIINKVFGSKVPEPKICYTCGKLIKDTNYKYFKDEKEYHICSSCLLHTQKCDNCFFPVKQALKGTTKIYCNSCRGGGTCSSCGIEVSSKSVTKIPYISGIFCSSCINFAPRCYNCNKPIKENSKRIADGRNFCKDCHARLILTTKEAQELFDKLIFSMNFALRIKEKLYSQIQIVPFQELNERLSDRVFSRVEETSYVRKILLANSTTYEKAIGDFSFDLGKYLFSKYYPTKTDLKYSIGFAIWFKSLMLREFGYVKDYYEIKNKEDEFAKVIRFFYNVEISSGLSKIIEKVKTGDFKRVK